MRQFFVYPDDYQLSDAYEKLSMPTLLLRGEKSDLLSRETAAVMTQTGPRAQLVEIEGCGHAPCLNVESQIAIVREFLASC